MKKSLMARIVSLYFRVLPKYTEEQWKARIQKQGTEPEKPPRPPKGVLYRLDEYPSGKVFRINENSRSGITVFYLHGGAYVHDFSRFHWLFLKKILKRTGAEIIAPAYRLAPHGTWREAFELIVPLYREYREEHPDRKMILMGDSAGGGLALALAEYFQQEGITAPEELILLSPWVDVSMSNPSIDGCKDRDPWITASYRIAGICWAGEAGAADWRVSPLHGEMRGLKNVTVFFGTEEILRPDMKLLEEKLMQEASNEMIEKQGMNHVYPLLPIPEAGEAVELICRKITRDLI